MGERSHYEVLGLTARATADEVRAAYRRAARDNHPDAGGDSRAMSEINAAWRVLGDPARRAAYDRELARRPAPAAPTGAADARPDVDDPWTAAEWADRGDLADLDDDTPLRPTQPLEGWWAMLPPATLVAAAGVFFGAFIFSAPELLALSGGLTVLALGLFVLAPLRAMTRRDPD